MIDLAQVSVAVDEATLLAPVSATVAPGEVLVIRGPNGAGKSTLLRVIAGVQKPTSGAVTIAGMPVEERNPKFRRRVAAMVGLPPMAPDLTVVDHITLVAATWAETTHSPHAVAQLILAELGLSALRTRFPHELSSGQMQLFGLALALVRPCEVLLLDEPEQRLDDEHMRLVVEALKVRRDAGATLVIATHNYTLAAALGGRSLRLESAA